MKKIIIPIIIIMSGFFCSIDTSNAATIFTQETNLTQGRNVVFRSTQRLKARDGRIIILYTSGRCEMRDGDRVIVTTTYRVQDGEVRILDERGNTLYAGRYVLSRDRVNISSLTLAGTTYYKM